MAAIVQVAVGIIFVFILLSILVTEVNALIARSLKLRAKNLRQAMNEVIDDPVIRAKVYTHPLIQLVQAEPVAPTQRLNPDEARKIASSRIGAVDYIEPNTFVNVLLSTIKANSDQRLFGALLNVIDGMPAGKERRGLRVMVNRIVTTGAGMKDLRRALPYIQDRRYRGALTEIVNQIDEEVSLLGLAPTTNVALMAGIRQIDSASLRNSLTTVMSSAADMPAARANLETWFDKAMLRARASYAGKMKNLSIAVALFFALVFNIDSLEIARRLWEDPGMREQISAELAVSVQSGELGAQVEAETAGDDRYSASDAEGETGLGDALEAGATIANQLQDIQDLRLPVGWFFQAAPDGPQGAVARADPGNLWNFFPDNNPSGWLGLLAAKFLGIAATVIAAAQGAPFWFGLVNRLLRR